MGFDAFTKEQLKNALRAANLGISQTPRSSDPTDEAFRAGFECALAVIATSFGIEFALKEQLPTQGYYWSPSTRVITAPQESG